MNTPPSFPKSGSGCLVALIIFGALLLFGLVASTIEEHTPADPQERAATVAAVERFDQTLHQLDPQGTLLLGAQPRALYSSGDHLSPDTVFVTVSNGWFYALHQERVQLAQNLLAAWQQANPQGDMIFFHDVNGNLVGHSSSLGASVD
jgi:hypothetical protein